MTTTEPTGLSGPNPESLQRLQDTRFQMTAERIAESAATMEDKTEAGGMYDKYLGDALYEAAEGRIVTGENVVSGEELTDRLVSLADELKDAISKGDRSLVASALLLVPSAGGLRNGVDTLLKSPQAKDFLGALDRLRTPEVEARIGIEEKLGETAAVSSVELDTDEVPSDEEADVYDAWLRGETEGSVEAAAVRTPETDEERLTRERRSEDARAAAEAAYKRPEMQ